MKDCVGIVPPDSCVLNTHTVLYIWTQISPLIVQRGQLGLNRPGTPVVWFRLNKEKISPWSQTDLLAAESLRSHQPAEWKCAKMKEKTGTEENIRSRNKTAISDFPFWEHSFSACFTFLQSLRLPPSFSAVNQFSQCLLSAIKFSIGWKGKWDLILTLLCFAVISECDRPVIWIDARGSTSWIKMHRFKPLEWC